MNKKIFLLNLTILMGSLISIAGDEPKNTQLNRPSGYWSSSKDEEKTGIFSALTEPKSQREDWYSISPYIAEFGCTATTAYALLASR